jgi:pSer/pThr/pTyr-binding forkhead associated (FHA) protein
MAEHARLKLLPDGPFIEIDGDALYLGRDCHLAAGVPVLKNKVVSNRHCCFKQEPGGRWTIEDLGSTNGTWLKGTRLTKPEPLRSGDVVSLGHNGPRFECLLSQPVAEGPGATMPESDLEVPASSVERMAAAETVLAMPEGSAERPFKVGRTPHVMLRHELTGEQFSISGYTIVIGRDPAAAQVVVRSKGEKHVSGRHAEIQFHSDGSVVVRDLASRNGTWLNDRPLKEAAPLKVGDRLLLGNAPTVLIVVALDA